MTEKTKSRVIVGMPAYNEAKYIGSVILETRQYADEVIIVDDGSRDATARIASLAGATVVSHGQNRGYGHSIRSLIDGARQKNADVLVILDADSQHNPNEIPRLVEAIAEGADIVIGSRELEGNKNAGYRRAGQKVLTHMTGIASRQKLTDTESGFRAFSRKALDTLELKETGMAISSETISEAAAKGLKIIEVPISVAYGKDSSTLNPIAHGVGVFNRILVMISERRPLLFFSIFGGLALAAGLATGIMVLNLYYSSSSVFATGLALISMLFITIGMLTIFTGIILSVLVRRIGNR
jgi:glycosyltransferase involved in cell wall biosynthesis